MTAWRLPRELPTGTFRIDSTIRGGAVGLAAVVDALVLYIVLASEPPDRFNGFSLMMSLVVVVTAVAIAAQWPKFSFDGTTLRKRGLFGSRSFPTSSITKVSYDRDPRQPLAFVVAFRGGARGQIVLSVKYWDRTNDLVQLARVLDPRHAPDPVLNALETDEWGYQGRSWGAHPDE